MRPLDPPGEQEARDPGGSGLKARRSRRLLLKTLGISAPLGVLGAAIAPRAIAARTPGPSPTPADLAATADALRQSNLLAALATRDGPAVVADPPTPAIQPLVRTLLPPLPEDAGPRGSAAATAIAAEPYLVRMQRELQQAMTKPITERKWVMVIDLARCIGCSACTIACKAENLLPPGVVYRPVIEEEIGEYPNVSRRWLPRPCMQCDNPPCVPLCPVNATWKREDGIVVIDYKACIGCRYCLTACPYGARYFDFGDNYTDGTPAAQPYEKAPSPEYGRRWKRDGDASPVGNARKCTFCIHRLDAGMLPACVTTCIGSATFFGDLKDPDSLVSELVSEPRVMRLKEELGTKPKVYYLA